MIGTDGKLYISSSMLADLAACSTKAWLRYKKKVTASEHSSPMTAGTAIHAGIETYWKTSSKDSGLEAFDNIYKPFSDEWVPEDDRMSFANVRRTLSMYFDKHPIETLPFKVRKDLVELPFMAPLTDDIIIVGKPDAIVERHDDGHLYILDHKSTGRADDAWKAKFRIAPQLTCYIWAAREQLGAPVVGAFINLIEIKRPMTSTKKCPTHGVPYNECIHSETGILGPILRSEAQIAQWKSMAINLAEKYRQLCLEYATCANVPTEGIFHGACGYCEFNDFCSTGKNPQLESMFSPSTYDPLKGLNIEVV